MDTYVGAAQAVRGLDCAAEVGIAQVPMLRLLELWAAWLRRYAEPSQTGGELGQVWQVWNDPTTNGVALNALRTFRTMFLGCVLGEGRLFGAA